MHGRDLRNSGGPMTQRTTHLWYGQVEEGLHVFTHSGVSVLIDGKGSACVLHCSVNRQETSCYVAELKTACGERV